MGTWWLPEGSSFLDWAAARRARNGRSLSLQNFMARWDQSDSPYFLCDPSGRTPLINPFGDLPIFPRYG